MPYIPASRSNSGPARDRTIDGDAALPALIGALPEDNTRAPQHQFTRERQVEFLSRLAGTGSVLSAAKGSRISRQSAYRQRRACASFRHAWDAALVVALEQAEAELAERAIGGTEEEVWYHGEVVATRRRHDARLLLAHLARLDRKAGNPALAELAMDFDAVLARFAEGGDVELPVVAEAADAPGKGAAKGPAKGPATTAESSEPDISSGQCNTCSMSLHGEAADIPVLKRVLERIPPPGYAEWTEDMDDPANWTGRDYTPGYASDDASDDIVDGELPDEEWVPMAAFDEGFKDWRTMTSVAELNARILERDGPDEPAVQQAVMP